MSSYRTAAPRRRILRGDDGIRALAASLMVQAPASLSDPSAGTVQEMVDSARQAGYDEGYAAAMAEVVTAEATARSAQLRRAADSIVEAARTLSSARAGLLHQVEADAAELAYELAQALLQRELSSGPAVVDAVRRALALVEGEQVLVLRLNPADGVDPTELQALVPDAEVRVVPDPRVEPGGCVVDAGSCRIDAQLAPALGRVQEVLDQHFPGRRQEPRP